MWTSLRRWTIWDCIKYIWNSNNLIPYKDVTITTAIWESNHTSAPKSKYLSAIIHLKGASDAGTFHGFAVIIYIIYYIMGLSKGFTRIDIVGDQYFGHSVKEQIRKDKGTGTRKLFEDLTKFPKNPREDFLRNSQNKEDLNRYLAEKIISLHSGSQAVCRS